MCNKPGFHKYLCYKNISHLDILETSRDEGLTAWNDFEDYVENNNILSGNSKGNIHFSSYYNKNISKDIYDILLVLCFYNIFMLFVKRL